MVAIAPDAPQFHCVDHTSGDEVLQEHRRQLPEAARIVRGKIHALADISPKLLDGLIIPGGQGAVKNLMEGFGTMGEQKVFPRVADFLQAVHAARGAIGGISLAEFVLTALFGPFPEGRGNLDLPATGVLVDRDRRLLLTPGWLLASSLTDLHEGAQNLVARMIALIEEGDPQP